MLLLTAVKTNAAKQPNQHVHVQGDMPTHQIYSASDLQCMESIVLSVTKCETEMLTAASFLAQLSVSAGRHLATGGASVNQCSLMKQLLGYAERILAHALAGRPDLCCYACRHVHAIRCMPPAACHHVLICPVVSSAEHQLFISMPLWEPALTRAPLSSSLLCMLGACKCRNPHCCGSCWPNLVGTCHHIARFCILPTQTYTASWEVLCTQLVLHKATIWTIAMYWH